MGRKTIGQPSLAEAFLGPNAGSNRRLERIAALVDWPLVEALLTEIHAAPEGRPGYPPLAMFKALLLQQWYALSDPGLEEALSDRLSFRRFCGFGLADETPDATTLCRFRANLVRLGLAERAFAEVNAQFEQRGLLLKTGTLIDATLVEASVKRPPLQEGEVSERDPDAGFTRRGQTSFFGYKAHLAVDLGSDLIHSAILTGADLGESLVADALVQGDEAAVYADKAYDAQSRREALAEAGIVDGLMYRAHAHRRLKGWQKWMNVALTPIRGQVERVFGLMKRCYGYRRVRYRGLARNGAHLQLLCLAINLRRAERLLA